MKRLIIIFPIIAIVVICILTGCKKKDLSPSRLVTISYPAITLLGPSDTTINRNATWLDPGATWKDTVTGESGTITLSVNTSKDSAYLLVYTATNKNGFQSIAYRGLAVTNMGSSTDISGAYTDNNGNPDTIVKVSRAFFYIPNADNYGDGSLLAIKSDSTICIATIITSITGAPIPETFTQASIIYQPSFYYTGNPPHIVQQPPVIISYTATPLNVPPVPVTLTHN